MSKTLKQKLVAYALVLPAFLVVMLTVAYPIVSAVIQSFQDEKTGAFTLDNYAYFFTEPAQRMNILYTLFVVIATVVIALVVAYLLALYLRFVHSGIAKSIGTLYLLPRFVPAMCAVYAMITIIRDSGLINRIGLHFGMNLKLLPTVGLNSAAAYIMPVTALAIYPSAYITRLMRSSLLDVMGQDYMRTARAKGVSSVKILFKHALRNAILPVITYVGPMLAGLMTGSFVVEKIFSIPGLGRDFVSAITNRDYMMIMGTTILLATLVIVANVVVDILYKIIDPRIKLK